MRYSDDQLKRALAKMLPDTIHYLRWPHGIELMCWRYKVGRPEEPVRDTELLGLCAMVEQQLLKEGSATNYRHELMAVIVEDDGAYLNNSYPSSTLAVCATWQQRTVAQAKVKGVEIL